MIRFLEVERRLVQEPAPRLLNRYLFPLHPYKTRLDHTLAVTCKRMLLTRFLSRALGYLEFKVCEIYIDMRMPMSQTQRPKSTPLLYPRNQLGLSSNDDSPCLEDLAQEFPTGDFENWARCHQLLPRANMVYNSTPVTPESWEAWAQTVTNLAWYLWKKGDYQKARAMITDALTVREIVLGPNDLRTLLSIEILAGVLLDQGSHGEAAAMHSWALKGFKETLGSLHPFTLTSTSNLALALQHLGRYRDSERLSSLALRGSQLALGPYHADTLTSMGNLALVLQHQGKYERAKRLNEQSLSAFSEILGKWHPSTLTSTSNLAVVLQCQGKYEESEELLRKSLQGRVEVLGWNHPSTIKGIDSLISVLERQGKWADTEQLRQCKESIVSADLSRIISAGFLQPVNDILAV